MPFINGTNHVKRSFESALRVAFSTDLAPEKFRYSSDKEKSQIAIYKEFPQTVEKYPAIVVQAEASDAGMTFLGNELVQDVYANGKQKSVLFAGSLSIPVRIIVLAKSSDDREQVTDLAIFCVRHLFRNTLAALDISYKNIRVDSEGQEVGPDGEVQYTSGVSVDCYTEYRREVSLESLTAVRNVEVTVTSEEP